MLQNATTNRSNIVSRIIPIYSGKGDLNLLVTGGIKMPDKYRDDEVIRVAVQNYVYGRNSTIVAVGTLSTFYDLSNLSDAGSDAVLNIQLELRYKGYKYYTIHMNPLHFNIKNMVNEELKYPSDLIYDRLHSVIDRVMNIMFNCMRIEISYQSFYLTFSSEMCKYDLELAESNNFIAKVSDIEHYLVEDDMVRVYDVITDYINANKYRSVPRFYPMFHLNIFSRVLAYVDNSVISKIIRDKDLVKIIPFIIYAEDNKPAADFYDGDIIMAFVVCPMIPTKDCFILTYNISSADSEIVNDVMNYFLETTEHGPLNLSSVLSISSVDNIAISDTDMGISHIIINMELALNRYKNLNSYKHYDLKFELDAEFHADDETVNQIGDGKVSRC